MANPNYYNNTKQAGAVLGNIRTPSAVDAAPPPQTINSAIGRMRDLNERLTTIRDRLCKVSEQIGAPYPANESMGAPAASGAVAQLNDSADMAHGYASEIEGLLESIARALG